LSPRAILTPMATASEARNFLRRTFSARGLLSGFHCFPIQLMERIEGRRETLLEILNGTAVCVLPAVQGYFLSIEGRASVLLKEHGLLTIPATVFCSGLLHWSVASALSPGDSL
jgi:hypothetical protein